VPVLAAAVKVTVPLPVPPAVTDSQPELLDACHEHPLGATTDTVAVPPVTGTRPVVSARSIRQGAAAWLIVARCPLTVTSPWRAVPSGFGATRNATSELPWPDAGESADIQFASVAAVQVHSGWVATVMLPAPPAESIADEAAVTETAHFAGVGPTPVVVVAVAPHAEASAASINATATRSRSWNGIHISGVNGVLGLVMALTEMPNFTRNKYKDGANQWQAREYRTTLSHRSSRTGGLRRLASEDYESGAESFKGDLISDAGFVARSASADSTKWPLHEDFAKTIS